MRGIYSELQPSYQRFRKGISTFNNRQMNRFLQYALGLILAASLFASCATSYSACAAYAEVEVCE